LTKDNRSAIRQINLKLKKPLITIIPNENNKTAILSSFDEKKIEMDLTDLIIIEHNPMGITDLLFEVSLLDSNINLDNYKYEWNIPHFTYKDQYINGVNELKLRVKQNDLLIGVNKIIINMMEIKTKKNYSKTYDYEKHSSPYGGECRIEPFDGYSFLTNFTFIVPNWISNTKTLIYKIKFENKNKILFDLSNGGFSQNTFSIENLPVGNKLFLEVIDMRGLSTIFPCQVNVRINKNLPSLDNLLENIVDVSKKLLIIEVYQTNVKEDGVSDKVVGNSINILNNYFDNLSLNDFLNNYEKLISTIITVSNQTLTNDNITKLFEILNLIIKYIDPLLNDITKFEYLFSILDKLNKKVGDKLLSIIISRKFFKFLLQKFPIFKKGNY